MKKLLSKKKVKELFQKAGKLGITIIASLFFILFIAYWLHWGMVITAKLCQFDRDYQRVECDVCMASLPAETIEYCSTCGADEEHLWLVKASFCPECGKTYSEDDIQFCTNDGTPVEERKVRMDQISWVDIFKLSLIKSLT